MAVTTADIKQLRESTGAGVLDCKKALQATDGDVDQAIDFLRKKGLASASKKASREANDGLINAALNDAGTVGAIVEVNCETDFVARTEDFTNFVDSLVRQVLEQPEIIDVEALLNAPYINDPGQTVSEFLPELIAKLGENTVVRNVVRYSLDGDGTLDTYIHPGGRVGVLVEINGGSGEAVLEMAHDVALQIAAASPRFLSEADVPAEVIAAEKEVYRAQLVDDKKPDNIKERIIEGKLKKWYSEVTLLNQQFVKDSNLTITQLVQQTGKQTGQNLAVKRFARFELGAN